MLVLQYMVPTLLSLAFLSSILLPFDVVWLEIIECNTPSIGIGRHIHTFIEGIVILILSMYDATNLNKKRLKKVRLCIALQQHYLSRTLHPFWFTCLVLERISFCLGVRENSWIHWSVVHNGLSHILVLPWLTWNLKCGDTKKAPCVRY